MNNYPWISYADLKRAKGTNPDYTSLDDSLELCVNTATADLTKILGRNLSRNTYTEYPRVTSSTKSQYNVYQDTVYTNTILQEVKPIELRNYPVDSTADFKVYLDSGYGYTQEVDPSMYSVDYESGFIYPYFFIPSGHRRIKVEYTGGYAPTLVDGVNTIKNSIPDDLVYACTIQAIHLSDKISSSNINVYTRVSEGKSGEARFVNTGGLAQEAVIRVKKHTRIRTSVI